MEYRPDVDGLRAIAVLSVFVFHLNGRWLTGGFVGVDVFFVISGYLITSVIFHDMASGRFSLLSFYQRRIARIFPAFFLVVAVTLAGAYCFYSEMDVASTFANAAFATLSLANIKLMFQGNYFQLSRDAQPLLHYWSLSVEEQFYFLYPSFCLLIGRRQRHTKLLLMGGVAAVSFVACVLLTWKNPVFAFYLLPTRAWELLLGGALAISDPVSLSERSRGRQFLAVAGLTLIATSFLVLTESAAFPGYRALLPVAGTLCIIAARPEDDSVTGRFLRSPIMVLIGKMSYSLYLWHWPVFSLVDYSLYASNAMLRIGLKIFLSLSATVATFYLLEKPARTYLNSPLARRQAFAFLAIAAVCFVTIGAIGRRMNYVSATPWAVAHGGITWDNGQSRGSIVLMGDSQASMYARMLRDLAISHGYRLTVTSVAGGDPLPAVGDGPMSLWRSVFRDVRTERPDVLVIGCNWIERIGGQRSRLVAALKAVKPYVGRTILLTQPPEPPACASRAGIRDGAQPPFFEDPAVRKLRRGVAAYIESTASADVAIFDVEPYFLGRRGEILFADERGAQLYQDSGHLSGAGAVRIRDDLDRLLRESSVAIRSRK